MAQLIVNNGVSDSLPVTTTLVNFVNQPPVALDLSITGPEDSPCIPVTLKGIDAESSPTSLNPGIIFRRIISTTNGVLSDFVDADETGESTLCYKPRRFFDGFDDFRYEALDNGFPWGCGEEAPGCLARKSSTPGFGVIEVIELP